MVALSFSWVELEKMVILPLTYRRLKTSSTMRAHRSLGTWFVPTIHLHLPDADRGDL